MNKGKSGWMTGRTRRKLRENVIAWLFLLPAVFIIFTFGIFPILFAGYVSLYKWKILQGDYLGLGNYVKAMGDAAYPFFLIIALALLIYGVLMFTRSSKESTELGLSRWLPLPYIIPAVITTAGLTLILLRAITFFAQERAITAGSAAILGNFWLGLALTITGGLIGALIHQRQRRTKHVVADIVPNHTVTLVAMMLAVGAAGFIAWFTLNALTTSDRYDEARRQTVLMLSSLIPFTVGYLIWRWANKQLSNRRMIGGILAAVFFIAAGVWLLVVWPQATANADPKFYQSLGVTILYALGTVPFQLSISMGLAYLLFQNIKAKGLFRVLFFIPYIAPAVATAGIFQAMFSLRETSLANALMAALGAAPLRWLQESSTFVAAFGESFGIEFLSDFAHGPSLALVVIILYNIWVYVGYDTVIFLAGLGNIPNTVYEAAKIDGASAWQSFRHVTLPLLSPTTYFLSVISVIGTFKAFNHIYVLSSPAAQGTVDTASVFFFNKFQRASSFGYATSMAVVLFVIILTLYFIQNRIAERTVHYG